MNLKKRPSKAPEDYQLQCVACGHVTVRSKLVENGKNELCCPKCGAVVIPFLGGSS